MLRDSCATSRVPDTNNAMHSPTDRAEGETVIEPPSGMQTIALRWVDVGREVGRVA
jgi:hypothetical protein